MADFPGQGGVSGAHEAQPVTDGKPREFGTQKPPEGQLVEPQKAAGVGGSHRGAH